MMKRILAGLAALVLLLGIGWMIYSRIEGRRVPPRAGRTSAVPVKTAAIGFETLFDEGVFRGALIARSQFILAPKVPGRLQTLEVDIGDEVRRGDLIAVLDGEEYAHQLAQAQAELDVGRAALEEAESAFAVAASDLRRAQELHKERIASDAELEESESRKRAAAARVKLAKAQIRQREALLRSAEVRLAYTRLHAEWNRGGDNTWLVAERFADEGSMLRANDPVVSVVDINKLLAVIHVIERDFPQVEPGLPVFLRTDAYPGREFEGRIVRRAPVLDEMSRHARVEIEVANPGRDLAPGMFVRARVRFDTRENARVLPLSALARRGDRKGVFIVDPESMTVRFTEIETGIQSGDRVELLRPELEGTVVILGHHLLEDGGAVILTSDEEASPQRGGGRR